jgi:hypothetical protein
VGAVDLLATAAEMALVTVLLTAVALATLKLR